MMKAFQAAAALAFVGHASAFWRMPCRSRTGLARIDPIVDTGAISAHVHAIHGGGNFGFTTTYEDLNATGSCTSCDVTQDHSAYWTPGLYFMYDNGTTVLVDQIGGMLAYYLYYLDNVKAFPEGFQMIAGNNSLRSFNGSFPDAQLSSWPLDPTDQAWLGQRALGFNCLNYEKDPEPSLYRHKMPQKGYMDANCVDGIRLELAFPSCWNGELDSEDHSSHVAYPSLVKEGNCPESHPKHLPFLFYETIWNTYAFAGESGDFVLSPGDPTGAGYHGDFIMGWESEHFLQSALDNCQNPSGEISDCDLFNIQDESIAGQCTFTTPEDLMDDDCEGPREGLPVNVPVQWGPGLATAFAVEGVNPSATSPTYSRPSTFNQGPETQTYSPADPASTSTAQGGIVVAMKSDSGPMASDATAAMTPASSPAVTTSPSTATASSADAAVTTSYITKGNEVIELAIVEVDVTVTATTTAPAIHRRHLEKHLRHDHIRH